MKDCNFEIIGKVSYAMIGGVIKTIRCSKKMFSWKKIEIKRWREQRKEKKCVKN